MTCASFAQLSRHLVAFLIFGAKPGNICIAHVVHVLHQIAYAITIDRIAKTRLSRNFVAFGDCDLAHVVAEASEFSALQIVPSPRAAHPCGDALFDFRIGPVSHHYLTVKAQACVNKTRLAIAVCGLIEVHEIHVNLAPRQITVELCMQMQKRLPQSAKTADPHL